MALLFSDRVAYSAIVDRPPLRLPDNARVAVWVIVNVEHWSADGPMPRVVIPPPMHQPLLPDLPNWAWHEYGMPVGFWRILEALSSRRITPTLALNGHVCRSYPRVTSAAHEAGWEFIGHGYKQTPMHRVEDQRTAIRETIAEIARVTGGPPRGWESPGMTETEHTLDVLSSEGIEYVADWVFDDQPVVVKAEPRPVVAMPYTVETNDVVMFTIQNPPRKNLPTAAARSSIGSMRMARRPPASWRSACIPTCPASRIGSVGSRPCSITSAAMPT